ncbi:hypothetical protein ACE83Q_00525 [Dellaglioa sp. P0083]|uniref:hypothetical protein n=1 Tax=Dellaglioa kimchii TaxID=3344667 RepID=UPI0038D38969
MHKKFRTSRLTRISLASIVANLFILSMYVPKQIKATPRSDSEDSRVAPVNPMDPRKNAEPVSPKVSAPKKQKPRKVKKKVTDKSPIAFVSTQHSVTPIKPPVALSVSYSGYLVRHLSGNLLYGSKTRSSDAIILKETKE